MKDFITYCTTLADLDENAIEDLYNSTVEKQYKRGESLLSQGQTCKYLYFINEGLAKVFSFKDDKEFIMRFFAEGIPFSVFDSFIAQSHSKYTILALEDMAVTRIAYQDLMELCKRHHNIETLFRIITSQTAVRMTKRINEILEEDASERYAIFLKDNSAIIQRISLGDLAKYLGITQQSLSRIRALK